MRLNDGVFVIARPAFANLGQSGDHRSPDLISNNRQLQYIEPGTYLFRFMDPNGKYFWPNIAEILSKKTLVLNSRINFNDPFDGQPIIENDLSNLAIRSYYRDVLDDPCNPRHSLAATFQALELSRNGRTNPGKKLIKNVKMDLRKSAQHILESGGLLSFSRTAENPLLWGHYAASFSGICAVFRRGLFPDSAFAMCADVVYGKIRPRLKLSLIHEMTRRRMAGESHDDLVNQIFFFSFLHKSNHWAHEHEARIFYPFHAFKGLPFDSNELVGFILGPKASLELETRFRNEIKSRNPSVSIDRAQLSPSDYRIIVPHKFIHFRAAA